MSYIIAFISTMFNQLGCLFSYVGHTAIKEEKRGKPNTFSNWHNIHQLTFNAQSAPAHTFKYSIVKILSDSCLQHATQQQKLYSYWFQIKITT